MAYQCVKIRQSYKYIDIQQNKIKNSQIQIETTISSINMNQTLLTFQL